MSLKQLYRPALGLLTDLYQVVMAYGYWKSSRHDWQSIFHWTLRRLPFGGGFAVACGQETVVELLQSYRFEAEDLEFLSGLVGIDGKTLFEPGFVAALGELEARCDIDAAPEGSVVFAGEPLLRVTAPLWLGQLLETPLLNQLNFQTLIATKAARIAHLAAAGQPVIEFGLRRSQGIDGGVTAARAAYVGGCAGTSNLLAGRLFGIPVMGTHAHSWVLSFEDEVEAFRAFAEAQPNNCTLLVDTYDTEAGLENAVRVGREMGRRGHQMAGIRLDSGDLLELSRRARELLDQGGLDEASIVAASDLDEFCIARLRADGARIDVWGVGTRLSTGHPEAASSGVYKLGALRRSPSDAWRPVVKLSEDPGKSTEPGWLAVRRYSSREGLLMGDAVYGESHGPPVVERGACRLVDRISGEELEVRGIVREEELLQPLVRDGLRVPGAPSLAESRSRVDDELARLPGAAKSLEAPETIPVGLDRRLYDLKRKLSGCRRR